jgi:hypothetical protein
MYFYPYSYSVLSFFFILICNCSSSCGFDFGLCEEMLLINKHPIISNAPGNLNGILNRVHNKKKLYWYLYVG